ncbi:CDP-glycerol glycerophosphotransferase family protein [Levilactobacillus brevis]|uniref:CDP-glycerol glycerophosphotransferase family protein n=1 Tax=Levilactobacillus brevis TaxID=1580 RepID=UPI003D172FA6
MNLGESIIKIAKSGIRYLYLIFVITLNQFIKIDKSYVVFNSFYGKRIDDSPRIIYEKLKEKKNNLKCYSVVDRRAKNLLK